MGDIYWRFTFVRNEMRDFTVVDRFLPNNHKTIILYYSLCAILLLSHGFFTSKCDLPVVDISIYISYISIRRSFSAY